MSYLDKLYQKGEQKINELRSKASDPIAEFEAELRKLRTELQQTLKASARTKALIIQGESDVEFHENKASELTTKATEIINSTTLEPKASESAALHILALKKNSLKKAAAIKNEIPKLEEESAKIEQVLTELKINIRKFENYLDDYKLKAKIEKISREAKKVQSFVNYESDTVQKLEKLKEQMDIMQVEKDLEDENLSDLLNEDMDIDKDIFDELEELKKK